MLLPKQSQVGLRDKTSPQKHPKVGLVVGGAKCVWQDIHRACSLFRPDYVCCINIIGIDWQWQFDYWVSFHPYEMEEWVKKRNAQNLQPPGLVVVGSGPQRPLQIDNYAVHPHRGGSSGLLGAMVLLDWAADKVVFAGVPMDPEQRHYHNRDEGRPWKDAPLHRNKWNDHMQLLQLKARSMSGWTRQKLGEPTQEWLTT